MILDLNNRRIYLKPGTSPMRYTTSDYAVIVQEEMNLDIFSKDVFLFCDSRRKRLRIIYWDLNGFCQWEKRLHYDIFPWPKEKSPYVEISREQLTLLLTGINFFTAHKEIKNKSII